jgi:hypothetical protein
MREVNSFGGYKLLDCLSGTQIEKIIDEIISQKLQLTKLLSNRHSAT